MRREPGTIWEAVPVPKESGCPLALRVQNVQAPLGACTSGGRQTGNKVPLNQGALQDSAMPVHLKGGSGDTLLYRLTMRLTVLGSGYIIYELAKATLPKKTE